MIFPPEILVAHPKLLNWNLHGPSQNIEKGILINNFARSPKDDFQFKNE